MKKSTTKFWILLLLACVIGFFLGKLDTSKNWNDTGITAGAILLSSFLLGALMTNFAWLWAIIIGGFIFCFNIILSGNYGSAGAFLFAFAGAYAGVLFRKYIVASLVK